VFAPRSEPIKVISLIYLSFKSFDKNALAQRLISTNEPRKTLSNPLCQWLESIGGKPWRAVAVKSSPTV
jgi:hypothetical protein